MRNFIILGSLVLMFCSSASAFERTGNMGIGYTFTGTTNSGLSAKYQVDDMIDAGAVIGFWGAYTVLAARGYYNFRKDDKWSLYGWGSGGYYERDWCPFFTCSGDTTADSVGFAGGAGIEINWQELAPDLPPVFFSLELGFQYLNFTWDFGTLGTKEESHTSLIMGGGAHYFFDL